MSKQIGKILLIVLTASCVLGGCADRYDQAPQQPATVKTYSVYKKAQHPKGVHLTQIPGVIDMISGLTR